jgi:hypothetical protein
MKLLKEIRERFQARQKIGQLLKKFDSNARMALLNLAITFILAASSDGLSAEEMVLLDADWQDLKKALKD